MRLANFSMTCGLTLAVAALGTTMTLAGSQHREAATSTHTVSGGVGDDRSPSGAVSDSRIEPVRGGDHDAHRDRDGGVIVYDDDVFWDPVWGWYGPPYAYPPYSSERDSIRAHRGLVPIELHVHPWKASVILDQRVLGQARDYNDDSRPLWVRPGEHVVELQYPGYQTLRFELDAEKGLPRDLHFRLMKGKGLDPRSQTDKDSDGG